MNTNNDNHYAKAKSLTQIAIGVFGMTTLFFSGCAICCGPYDYNYPAFGGTVQRSDPVYGRVGSIYSDPGPFGGPSADYNLKPHDSGQNNSSFDAGDDELESLNGNDDLTPPDMLDDDAGNGSDNRNSDLLPPPADQIDEPGRPSPDESTSIRRRRTQSRRQRPVRRWR